jgi:purine nucleosidase
MKTSYFFLKIKQIGLLLIPASALLFLQSCKNRTDIRIPVIIDTDANNELDDQHALAYLFFNGKTFIVPGVTVNATSGGGDINEQAKEAERVMKLCRVNRKIPLYKGANGSFENIKGYIQQQQFDGSDAVNFIISEAKKHRDKKLVLIPIGKLTNIALALAKDQSIAEKVRIVWLGSNYPDPGEYNLGNDIPALNYILSLDVPFEMVTVRYGKATGTSHVFVTKEEILSFMQGRGPKSEPVEGRHGGFFTTFGDYSVNLFENCKFYGNPPQRSLFDMAAVSIIKNPSWAQKKEIPAPIYQNSGWKEQPENQRRITIWENFNREAILADFFSSIKDFHISKNK